ncbi:MAG: hypothetical protein IMY72_07785 [Bacteroidetes bacterium]|nr:hypothetical protein [Bacteroidota bacterium]
MYKLIFSLLLVTFISTVKSQEIYNYTSVNNKSFLLYQQNNWKELIKYGNNSLKSNVDFYYLQYRMGIAYYELKNYRKSIPFFEKVVSETPNDNIALEYLYYAYVFSGRTEDARILSHSFTPNLKQKLKFYNENSFVNGIGTEYKTNLYENYKADLKIIDNLEQTVSNSFNYFSVNLTHLSKNKLKVFHAFSYINATNDIYSQNYSVDEFTENVNMFQYYINCNWHVAKGSNLSLGLHSVNTNIKAEDIISSNHGGKNVNLLYNLKTNNLVFFGAFSKNISLFDIKLSASLSNLNSGTQIQPSLSLYYYPFANTKFYFGTQGFYQYATKDNVNTSKYIIKGNLGFVPFKSLTIEPFIFVGNGIYNFIYNDALVINNSIDKLNNIFGSTFYLSLNKGKMQIFAIFQQSSYTNTYSINGEYNDIKYINNSITGGIKWYF